MGSSIASRGRDVAASIGRRDFIRSSLAAGAGALLPAGRIWADAASSGAIPSALTAVTGSGRALSLTASDIKDFRSSLRGELLLAGDEGYDRARRIWNGAFDRRPALIARCAGAADVSQAVKFARTHGLLVAVRGGGHSLSGQSVCDRGLMIDLSRMRSIRIDPVARIARVEPGVLLGELDRESQYFGLATPAGTISHTGVAGLTLGGGFGRLARKFGLACDNLRAADLVTADGRLVRATAEDNPDLLWGLKGGGGNFGIATSFEFELHPIGPTLYGGNLLFPIGNARAVLEEFAHFAENAPDEAYSDAALTHVPQAGTVLALNLCYCGAVANAERVFKPLRQVRKPLLDTLGPAPYVALQSAGDGAWVPGRGYYERSGFLPRLEPSLIEAIVARMQAPHPAGAGIGIPHTGGAISRVHPTATAFWHREARHMILAHGDWDDPHDRASAETNMHWARETWPLIEPFTRGFYVNTMAPDDSRQRVRATYGDNHPRLVELKNRFDPTNLFRLNANIPPTAQG